MNGLDKVMQSAVGAALERAAQATGVDFAQLVETARRESSFDARAKAATSSAAGLFQFIEGTWLTMVARHGAKHGLAREAAAIDLSSGRPKVADGATREAILALRFDPEYAARLAGELTRENAQTLEAALGRSATRGELYAAHVMGAAGALRLVRAAQEDAPNAAVIFPREAAANRALFYRKDGAPRSADELLGRLTSLVGEQRAASPINPPVATDAPPQTPVSSAAAASIDLEEIRAAMISAALRALFDANAMGADATRLLAIAAYGRRDP